MGKGVSGEQNARAIEEIGGWLFGIRGRGCRVLAEYHDAQAALCLVVAAGEIAPINCPGIASLRRGKC